MKLRSITLGIVLAATAALPACICTQNGSSAPQETAIHYFCYRFSKIFIYQAYLLASIAERLKEPSVPLF